jgi:broad specificity phosphatase PhoE
MRAGPALVAALLPAALAIPPASASEALWALLKEGGQVVMIRHASTVPGAGDPPGFRLDDCGTQRNLSAAGRDEARRLGAAFRQRGIPVGRVLSSQWCRCLETARLAFGRAEAWPPLNSFFDDRGREPEQTRAIRTLVGERPGEATLVLVTHQVNISALVGVFPAPGELVILTPERHGQFRVAGRIPPP